jgi:DNA-binding NtrC family response regulator
MTPTRKLLCVNFTQPEQDPYPSLLSLGWLPLKTARFSEAAELAACHKPGVGLLWLTGSMLQDHKSIPELVSSCGAMAWVAILAPGLLADRSARALIARHFNDYQTLPLDIARLSVILGHLNGMAVLLGEAGQAAENPDGMDWPDEDILDKSLLAELHRAADVDEPVLIIGAAGTEKERIARLIHRLSSRQDGVFCQLNCADPSLCQLEWALFGRVGSRSEPPRPPQPGRLEASEGGTLFLDEIGRLSPRLQRRLLDVLQHGTLRRTGGQEDIPVNVRLIVANPLDLKAAVRQGDFLDDLYRRFSMLTLQLPSLAARQADIERLAAHYLRLLMGDRERPILGFTFRAIQTMREHDWPENTRELVRRLKQAVVACQGDMIDVGDMGFLPTQSMYSGEKPSVLTLEQAKADAEKQIILNTLKVTGNNISRAARRLAVSRMTLYRLLDKHQLRGKGGYLERLRITAS